MQLKKHLAKIGDIGGSAKKVGKRIKELERLYGIREGSLNEKGNNRIGEPNNSVDQITQSDLAAKLGISVDTLQNYKMMADMIPELEELMDTGIDPEKDRRAIKKYVELKGYKNGELGNGRKKECQDGTAKLTLDEIAKELNTSKRNFISPFMLIRQFVD